MDTDPTGKWKQANRQLEHHHLYLGLQDLEHQRAAPLTRLRRHARKKSAAAAAAGTTAASAQHDRRPAGTGNSRHESQAHIRVPAMRPVHHHRRPDSQTHQPGRMGPRPLRTRSQRHTRLDRQQLPEDTAVSAEMTKGEYVASDIACRQYGPGMYDRPCRRCRALPDKSVTATPLCSSCNACMWCDVGAMPDYHEHCAACHSDWHSSCRGCVTCMTTLSNRRGTVRSDRRYCSSACRQRAYRNRRNT